MLTIRLNEIKEKIIATISETLKTAALEKPLFDNDIRTISQEIQELIDNHVDKISSQKSWITRSGIVTAIDDLLKQETNSKLHDIANNKQSAEITSLFEDLYRFLELIKLEKRLEENRDYSEEEDCYHETTVVNGIKIEALKDAESEQYMFVLESPDGDYKQYFAVGGAFMDAKYREMAGSQTTARNILELITEKIQKNPDASKYSADQELDDLTENLYKFIDKNYWNKKISKAEFTEDERLADLENQAEEAKSQITALVAEALKNTPAATNNPLYKNASEFQQRIQELLKTEAGRPGYDFEKRLLRTIEIEYSNKTDSRLSTDLEKEAYHQLRGAIFRFNKARWLHELETKLAKDRENTEAYHETIVVKGIQIEVLQDSETKNYEFILNAVGDDFKLEFFPGGTLTADEDPRYRRDPEIAKKVFELIKDGLESDLDTLLEKYTPYYSYTMYSLVRSIDSCTDQPGIHGAEELATQLSMFVYNVFWIDKIKADKKAEAEAEALQQEILLTKLARLKGIDAVTERYIDQQQVDAVEYDKKREEYLKDPSLLTNQLARINRKTDIRSHLKPYLDDDGVMYRVLSEGEDSANLTSLLSERLANDKDFIKKCVEANPQVLIWSEFADDRELRKQVIDADPGIVLQLWHNDNPEEWIQAVRLKPEVLFERRFTAKVPEEIFFHSKPVWEAAIKAMPDLVLDEERVPDTWRKDLDLLLIAANEDPSILESPKLHPDIKKSLNALEKKFGKI